MLEGWNGVVSKGGKIQMRAMEIVVATTWSSTVAFQGSLEHFPPLDSLKEAVWL